MNTIVIYHKNCNDGFGSALVAWLKFGNDAEYYPATHYTQPPNVTNKKVFILDFSYSKEIILHMIQESSELLIIDHHISAQKALEEIPNENKIFDMTHSGATLTWKYFFPDKNIPLLLQYIEDRDIWKNELPNTKECFFGLCEIPKIFSEWSFYLNDFKIEELISNGKILCKHNNALITFISKSSYLVKEILKDNKEYNIAYLNSNVLKSDIGNFIISKLYPQANFSAIYHYDGNVNKTIFSLRSTDEKTDVSEIAKLYDGGGHRCASGLSITGLKSSIGN
jgi:uncharacterized protein